jgi:outer membrane receptor for ferrienterochelin and colicins
MMNLRHGGSLRRGWSLVLLLVALAAAHLPLAAEQTTGTLVVHVRSGTVPVEGAEVRAGSVRGVTNPAGRAQLTLPAGTVRVEVSRIGFAAATAQTVVVAGGETALQVELHIEAVEARGIIVTSTRTGRRLQDEPLRVEVLDREEIEEKLLMTPGNIVMLLNETGGLRVQVTSPSLGAANIRVQGMRGRYTQLLADGLPLYGGQAGAIGLLQIPPSDLGQVEVIKGVASALYGGSALGGVINLISREPTAEFEGDLLLNATSHNGQDAVAYLSGPLSDAWGYSLLAGHHRQRRQDLDGTGWAEVPSHDRWSVRPRLFWEGGEGRTAFLKVGGMTESREGGTLPGRTTPDGEAFPERLDTDRLDAGARARWPVGQLGVVEVRASGTVQDHDHRIGAVAERDRHRTGFAEATLAADAGVHTWLVGAAYQRDGYRSETFPGFDYTFSVPALFAQHEVRVTPEITVASSARWDAHDEYGSQVSPRVSVLVRPGEWTVRASAGGGFFAPTPFTEEIEATGLSRLAPIEGLRVERARNASFDVGREVGPVELNATLFGSRVRDAVQLVPVEGGGDGGGVGSGVGAGDATVRVANVPGETRTAGVELLARVRWDDFGVTGSYVMVRATEPDPAGSGRRGVPLTPRHTAGLVAMWEDHDRGLLGVEAYYTGRQPLDDNPFRLEGRRHVHLGVLGEIRRGPVGVFLNLENLLDVRQTGYDPLVREVRAPDGRWTVDAWAPLEGFVVNGGVRIRFGDDH